MDDLRGNVRDVVRLLPRGVSSLPMLAFQSLLSDHPWGVALSASDAKLYAGWIDRPARYISCPPHAHWSPRINEGANDVIVACGDKLLLVNWRRARLLARYEACADPHSGRAIRKRRCETTPVRDAACGDDDDRLAGKRALHVLAEVDHGGDEDRKGRVAGVPAALAALSADHVNALRQCLLDVFRVADHAGHHPKFSVYAW